ncbi:MAG: WYL domain-containing protein [Symploca sp. SIO2D2]|nr:WYL domain-containing protein [Symploca sp. SIO2D2]
MAKKPQLHPYADRLSFERLLLLIATLIQYPGIGSPDPLEKSDKTQHHNALEPLQTQLRQLAQSLSIVLPPDYPALATIRKDLQTLRDYHILERRMYRWGYYLGTGVMSREELKVAFNALHSHALYQGDPQVRQIYHTLKQRLKGLDLETKGDFFYPVRAYLNRPIIDTDPEEMRAKGKFRQTLFQSLDRLEVAIAKGQLIELYRHQEPYQRQTGYLKIYPLQLFYHDIAWYLLYEEAETPHLYKPNQIQHLEVERLDRFKSHYQILQESGRGQAIQRESLKLAQKLMNTGWGIFLGKPEEQQLERLGKLLPQLVKVRFFPPSTHFILEGNRRHPNQKLSPGSQDSNGNYTYVDYQVKLPQRSFNEFSRWVYRHMSTAQFLAPEELVNKHRQEVQALAARYL